MVETQTACLVRAGGDRRPRLRLVCFPHAGGTPAAFRGWADRLPPEVELLIACYPGRHNRFADPLWTRMEPLADEAAAALLRLPDVPTALFGHSMGAAVAYEAAVRLQAAGRPPLRLFVSGHPAPHRERPVGVDYADADTLLERVNRLGSTMAGLLEIPELREIAIAMLKADYELIDTYQPAAPVPVSCPVVGYVGDQDQDCSAADIRSWGETTTARFELRVFHGGHFYLEPLEAELVGHVASHLRDDLRLRTAAAGPGGGRHV